MITDVFRIFPVLRTQHLALRSLVPDDLEAYTHIANHRGEATVSREKAKAVLQKLDTDYEQRLCINWGLCLEDRLIGTCGYYRGFAHGTGEIGYVMHPGFRRQGYMKEALQAIIMFGFDTLCLERIVAYTADENSGSVALLQKLGFIRTDETDRGDRKFEKLRPGDITSLMEA